MNEYKTLSHSVWECKYHIVFIPKYRQKKLYRTIRKELRDLFHKLSYQKECRIEEGYFVTTVGYNEEVVRRYIQNQEKADKQVEQQSLFKDINFN